MPEHNAGVAAVLSFFFSGLGQIYNGQIKKGLTIMFVASTSMIVIILGAVLVGYGLLAPNFNLTQIAVGTGLMFLSIVIICIVGVRSIFDAYNVAKQK